jgi:hypothetical protein
MPAGRRIRERQVNFMVFVFLCQIIERLNATTIAREPTRYSAAGALLLL